MPERFKVVCIPCKALYKCSAFTFTQRNFAAEFLQAKCHFTLKTAFCVFESLPLWELGAMYDVYLRLTGKSVVDFLLV